MARAVRRSRQRRNVGFRRLNDRRDHFDEIVSAFGVATKAKLAGPGDLHVDSWPAEWTHRFTDLLTLLTRLVDAEPAQAALLDKVLAGPLLTMPTLVQHGVRWPATATDRRPDFTAPTPPEAPSDRLF